MAPLATFAVTQTLSKRKHKLTIQSQLKKLKEFLNEVFNKLHNVNAMVFTFELTKASVIHCHGYITCTNESVKINKMLYNEFSKRVGYNCIKDINDLQGWIDYMNKDLSETLQALQALDARYVLRDITYKRVLSHVISHNFKELVIYNDDSELDEMIRSATNSEYQDN